MFLRTKTEINHNPDLLLLLHIFGVKQVYADLSKADIRQELLYLGSNPK
jgi:hypothetical protein